MPDHQSSPDETSHVFGNRNRNPLVKEWHIDLELIKAFGLTTALFSIIGGYLLSMNITFCDTCRLDLEKTYIVQLFGFPHTCVYIDENPAKTVSTVVFLFATLPLMFYTYLNKVCVERNYAAGEIQLKNVATFTKYTWLIRFFSFALVSLIYVNSPLYDPDPFVDPQHATWKQLFADKYWIQFILHYIPYFFWQLSLALMAIEQGWYHHAMETMPFSPHKAIIHIYLVLTWAVFLYYTVWIVGFLFGFWVPGHTYRDKEDPDVVFNKLWGKFIMALFNVLAIIVPIILAVCRSYGVGCKKSAIWVITFSPLKKEEENEVEGNHEENEVEGNHDIS